VGGGKLQLSNVGQIGDHLVHDLAALFDVSQLAAAKDDGDLHLILVEEKSPGLLDLEIQVMFARLGAEADFLELRMVCRLVRLDLLLVLVLAEVHHAANRRALVGRHLHQVQAHVAGSPQGLVHRNDSQLCSILRNHTYRGNTNLFVNPRLDLVDRFTLSCKRNGHAGGTSLGLVPAGAEIGG
jgi:hypothetical protein